MTSFAQLDNDLRKSLGVNRLQSRKVAPSKTTHACLNPRQCKDRLAHRLAQVACLLQHFDSVVFLLRRVAARRRHPACALRDTAVLMFKKQGDLVELASRYPGALAAQFMIARRERLL